MRKSLLLIFFLLTILSSNITASNQISVLTNGVGSTRPGYLKNSVLVVEPHGGYVEQSLYLEYTDNNQFPGHSDVEIVHRFELPEGSVINDLWLWIGDEVMQAIMLDTWTATAIYDSIVTNRRDPALLKKKGNQYELHIYPLTSGSFRKVKISFITPTKWFGENATAELPFKLLNSNNTEQKPLDILFRQKEDQWNKPSILESPQFEFEHLKDTLDFKYSLLHLDNIAYLGSLNLSFTTNFNSGNYFSLTQDKKGHSLFQLGILPRDFFDLTSDNSPKKILFGIDISGKTNNNIDQLLPNITNVMNSALKDGDSFEVIVSGADSIKDISGGWNNYSSTLVSNVLGNFKSSPFADSINKKTKPKLIFCDSDAKAGWSFDGINNYADVEEYATIVAAMQQFNSANIIAAYRHGYDDALTINDFNMLLVPLDSFFTKGGTFLTYFDHNRNGPEKIARHYINGLQAVTYSASAKTLYRNPNGNLANRLPQELDHNFIYTFSYNDPDVKIELMNADGKPVIISKKIKNGLLIVSGIWQIKDDGAMKTLLNPALLGLNIPESNLLLPSLLDKIKEEYTINNFDKCILFSNSDSLYNSNSVSLEVPQYLNSYSDAPIFNCVNLLNGNSISAPYQTIETKTYYGSGYFLNQLSSASHGLSFETNESDWNYITSQLSHSTLPVMENININVNVDGGLGSLIKLKEVNPIKNDPNKPLFYLGETDGTNSYTFNISATFKGIKNPIEKNINIVFENNNISEPLIPSLIANEDLKIMLAHTSYDTLSIVNLAKEYRLLCDYTAFIALEPNDTLHYMYKPFDESGMTAVTEEDSQTKDTVIVQVYPNPFNSQTIVKFRLNEVSKVSVTVYNLLGQKIIDLADDQMPAGDYSFRWNGKNAYGSSISSGIYLLRTYVEGIASGKRNISTNKLIYLK